MENLTQVSEARRIAEIRLAFPMLNKEQSFRLRQHERAGTIPEEDIRKAVMGEAWIPIEEHARKWGLEHLLHLRPDL